LEAALKYADAMKIFMKVAEGIMTAVLLATSGGTLSFALVATMGVLAQTGTMEKAVEALATKMGGSKIGAAALISALSVIAGAGLDGFEKMVSSVATTAVKTTVEGTSQVAIKAAAEAAVKAAGKTGAAATKEAEQIITKAVDVAVEKSLTNTFEKVGKSAFRKLLNAVQKGKSEVAAKELKEALTKAGEMAAKDAIKDAETIAVTVLKADSKMTLTEGLKASETAGQRAGSMAASKVSGMTDKQAEDAFVKSSKMSQKVLRAFSTRTASVGIYGLGSSNLLLEIEKSIAKKDSTEDQVLEALIGVFSAILSALSSAGASGVMKDADIFSGDKMASFLKWMSRLSKLSMAANAGGDLCSADAASRQGDAQANLKKIDGNIELFQLIISRILDSSKTESQKILKQMQVATASNNEFDPYRGDSAAVQVLIAG